jgi:phage shock protein PspC (stress-responsive transcriptional regulator)
MAPTDVPAPLSRPRQGRWLSGVAAGLARRWDVPAGRVRAAFVLTTPILGLGALVYVACWLIVPAEGEDGAGTGQRGVVLLAEACGALLGLTTLAVAATAATVFGFGWVVVALAGALLLGALVTWPRIGPVWALLLIGALVLPAAAVAMTGLRIEPQTASITVAPRTVADLPARGLRSGLGLLQLDLRHTALPATGTIPLRIDAGVRRTLVALPHDRCVHVEIRQHPAPFAARVGSVLSGAGTLDTPGATLFGRVRHENLITDARRGARRPGPTLRLDFSSAGGGLVVRDYPDAVDPRWTPDWPGYEVFPEPKPDTQGLREKKARRLLRAWQARHRRQVRSQATMQRLLPGPCAAPVPKRTPRKR